MGSHWLRREINVLQTLACAGVVVRTDSSTGGWLTTRTWSPLARAESLFVGAAASTRKRSSLKEGARRHERERRADQTFRRAAHDALVDGDGLRVQRGEHRERPRRKDAPHYFQQHEVEHWYSGARLSRSARSGGVLVWRYADLRQDVDEEIWNSRQQATWWWDFGALHFVAAVLKLSWQEE